MKDLKICLIFSLRAPFVPKRIFSEEKSCHYSEDSGYRITGGARIPHELATHLQNAGYQVKVITEHTEFKPTISDPNYEWYTLPGEFSLGNIECVRKGIKTIDPDVVHFHGAELMMYYAAICKLITNKPTLYTFTNLGHQMSSTNAQLKGRKIAAIERCIKSLHLSNLVQFYFDHLIFLTDNTRSIFTSKWSAKDKFSVISYGIEEKILRYQENPKMNSGSDKTVLFWGDGNYIRGFHTFLSAMDMIVQDNPRVQFVVAVRETLPKLREVALVKARKTKKLKIFDLTYEPYPCSILDLISSSTVITLPYSDIVGVDPPLTLLESMALGKGIVTTRVGSNPEVIGDDRGILVKAGDSRELADGIVKMLENNEKRKETGQNARLYISKHYDWDKVIHQMSHIYCDVLETCA